MGFKLGIVNYHYIRDAFPSAGIYGVTPKFFKYQLLEMQKNRFEFISLLQLEEAVRNKSIRDLPKKCMLITFDDGLRESFELGKSVLDTLSIPAGYFVSTGGIAHKKILNVHALHLIQQHLEIAKMFELLDKKIFFRLQNCPEIIIRNQYPWDEIKTSKLKYLFNFLLNDEEQRNYIEKCFRYLQFDEFQLSTELYMSTDQIQALQELNWLGSHAISHRALSTLKQSELEYELLKSKEHLSQHGNQLINSIAYPFGGVSSFNEGVLTEVNKSGYLCGMTMVKGFNSENEIMNSPLSLRRFDTNDLFGGKSHARYVELFHDDN